MAPLFGKGKLHKNVGNDIARLFSTHLTEDEARTLREKQWVDEDYRSEFRELAELHAEMEPLHNSERIAAVVNTPVYGFGRSQQWLWKVGAAAAVLLVAVSLGFKHYQDRLGGSESKSKVDRYVTKVGSQKQLTLADGSSITLNTGSEVLVNLKQDARLLTLVRGEAFFSVAKDAERPFTVNAGGQSVTVLGTAFNVRREPGGIDIAVESGHVIVHKPQEHLNHADYDAVEGIKNLDEPKYFPLFTQYHLKAGQQSKFDSDKGTVMLSRYDDDQKISEWRSGILTFRQAPLFDVVKELNRYSGKKILIEDQSIVNIPVSAVIRISRITAAVRGLEATSDVRVRHYPDRIVLESSQ